MELELLPDHVLIKIFQSLGNYDLLVCRTVSKRWLNLLRCKKYFDRIHRLQFSNCVLSPSCPPLSVVKNCTIPFFRYLTISSVRLENENDKNWNAAWMRLGSFLTYLRVNPFNTHYANLDLSKVLGNGDMWLNLIELEIEDTQFKFSPKLKINSLQKLKLEVEITNPFDLEVNFPNLKYLSLGHVSHELNNWELERLQEVSCSSDQLFIIKSDKIEKFTLIIDDNNFNVEEVETFIQKQTKLQKFALSDFDLAPTTQFRWCQWTQLTEIDFYLPRSHSGRVNLLRNYLLPLKNLKRVIVNNIVYDDNCFFGHETIDLPCLEYFSIERHSTYNCETCWETCMISFSNAKEAKLQIRSKINKFVHLLTNLEILTIIGGYRTVENWEFLKVPSLLKFDCLNQMVHESTFQKIAESFPNLRSLSLPIFDPIILRLLPALEYLQIYVETKNLSATNRLIHDIAEFGKNLRIVQIDGIKVDEVLIRLLFSELPLLLTLQIFLPQICLFRPQLYTRSSLKYLLN